MSTLDRNKKPSCGDPKLPLCTSLIAGPWQTQALNFKPKPKLLDPDFVRAQLRYFARFSETTTETVINPIINDPGNPNETRLGIINYEFEGDGCKLDDIGNVNAKNSNNQFMAKVMLPAEDYCEISIRVTGPVNIRDNIYRILLTRDPEFAPEDLHRFNLRVLLEGALYREG